MTGAQSMLMIDATVVGLALPSIQKSLNSSTTATQWVINIYLLTIAAFLAIGGWIGDRFGPLRVFSGGVLLFVAGLALAGSAKPVGSIELLLLARFIQGLGAALIIPTAQAIVTDTFAVGERGSAMGIWGSVSLVFMVMAPAFGGAVTQYIGWNWIFWLVIPIGFATLTIVFFARPTTKAKENIRPFDWRGAALLVFGLSLLTFGLMQAPRWGLIDPIVISLVGLGSFLLIVFIYVERRHAEPLVNMQLFRSNQFKVIALIFFFIGSPAMLVSIFLAQYLQRVLDFNATLAGVALIPMSIAMLALTIPGGRLYDKLGARLPVLLGLGLTSAGLLISAPLLNNFTYWMLVPGLLLIGAGVALVSTPANTDAMSSAPEDLRGEVAGVIQTVGQSGSSFMVATMTAIITGVGSREISNALKAAGIGDVSTKQVRDYFNNREPGKTPPGISSDQFQRFIDMARDSFVSGLAWVYLLIAVIMILLIIIAAFSLRGIDNSSTMAAEQPTPPNHR